MLSDEIAIGRRPMDDRPPVHGRAVSAPMSQESMARALPAAIRKASEIPSTSGAGWTVRITTRDGCRDVRLDSQSQVAHLTLELERLGFVLQVDAAPEADFVFDLPEAIEAG